MDNRLSAHSSLAAKVAVQFQACPQVAAIALGGSAAGGVKDVHSDIDLYVFTTATVPLEQRQAIVAQLGASETNLNLTFWDLGDEWYDLETGIEVDVIYWDTAWIAGQIKAVVEDHQAGMGYTTCFWHTISNAQALFDRQGWFRELQGQCQQPYPDPLRQAIIAKNHPVLRTAIPSYYTQINKALTRGDLISLNHRLAALLASYFDVLFALNRILHPGEKKIMAFVEAHCTMVPTDLRDQVNSCLQLAAVGDPELLNQLGSLLNSLDALLVREGLEFPSL
jgi:hypothetical protein